MSTQANGIVMRTEIEAKGSACPITNVSRAFTGWDKGCIGSRCMAWHWHDRAVCLFVKAPNPRAEYVAAAGERPEECEGWEFWSDSDNGGGGAGWMEPDEEAQKRRLGFCGMVKR